MATIKPVRVSHPWSHVTDIWKWAGVTEADTCEPVPLPHKPDETVQAVGDFGSGGQVDIHGAVPPQAAAGDYQILDDSFGDPMSFTDAAKTPKGIAPNVSHVKPVIAAGTGVLVDIYVIAV